MKNYIFPAILLFNIHLYASDQQDYRAISGKQAIPYQEFLMGTTVEYRNFIFSEEKNRIDQEFDNLKIQVSNLMALLPKSDSLARTSIMKILHNINVIHPIFISNLQKINWVIENANNNKYDYAQLNYLNESIQKNHEKSNLIKEKVKNELALLLVKHIK